MIGIESCPVAVRNIFLVCIALSTVVKYKHGNRAFVCTAQRFVNHYNARNELYENARSYSYVLDIMSPWRVN